MAVIILTAWCSWTKNTKNIAEVIQDYSWKLEKCDKDIRQRKLLVPNSYITREVSNTWWIYTWTIPVGGNLVLCNRQEFSSASLNVSMSSITWINQNIIWQLNDTGFFDTLNYPTSKFTLRNLNKNKNDYTMIWDLTIKDITKTISFKLNIVKNAPEYNFTWDVYLDITNRDIIPNNLDWWKIDNLIKISFDLKTKSMTKK